MKILSRSAAIFVLLAIQSVGPFAEDAARIPKIETPERVEVRLALIDVVVVDGEGRTVPGLTAEDFELTVDGRRTAIDTLDEECPGGAAEEPRAVRDPKLRSSGASREAPRKIVLVLDYLHLPLPPTEDWASGAFFQGHVRIDVLEQAKEMVRREGTTEEVMVVALTGGLRIEQPFTADKEETLRTLDRMENDITLYGPSFDHINETGFFGGLTALVDLLEAVDGPKAVVLFSMMPGGTEQFDQEFRRLGESAAISRASIYPVDAKGIGAFRFT